ncbi:MAG: cell wall hydrolase [Eubacteriales bacterium]
MKYIPALLLAAVIALSVTPIEPAEPLPTLPPAIPCAEITPLAEPIYYIVERTAETEPHTAAPTETAAEPCYPLREWERSMICRVLMTECPYEPPEGQRAVAQVILDRIHSKAYPDNVYDVLTQDGQFAGPSDADVLPEIAEAVEAVFDRGERVTEEPLYFFYAPRYGVSTWHERQEYITTIQNHKFYQ